MRLDGKSQWRETKALLGGQRSKEKGEVTAQLVDATDQETRTEDRGKRKEVDDARVSQHVICKRVVREIDIQRVMAVYAAVKKNDQANKQERWKVQPFTSPDLYENPDHADMKLGVTDLSRS